MREEPVDAASRAACVAECRMRGFTPIKIVQEDKRQHATANGQGNRMWHKLLLGVFPAILVLVILNSSVDFATKNTKFTKYQRSSH